MKLTETKRVNWKNAAIEKIYAEQERDLEQRINDFGMRYLKHEMDGKVHCLNSLFPKYVRKVNGFYMHTAGGSESLEFDFSEHLFFPNHSSSDTLVITADHPMFDEFLSLYKEEDQLNKAKREDGKRIYGVLRGFNTVKQIIDNFPELADAIGDIKENAEVKALTIIPEDIKAKLKSAAGK